MRPGGIEITKRAFDICGLPKHAKVLDIGCGHGDTAAWLATEYDLCVTGIDISAEAIDCAKEKHPGIEFMEGDGQYLDFDSLSFDCILMECTLSLMPNPVEAVHEAFCVLKKGGFLVVHDLYLPHPSAEDIEVIDRVRDSKAERSSSGSGCGDSRLQCTVSGALVLRDIDKALGELGFEIVLFEDRKPDLDSFAASLIFSGVSIDDYCGVKRGKSKISYYLQIAQKVAL